MSIERIVRPFQNGDVFTARVAVPVQPAIPATPDVSVVVITGSADSTYTEGPAPGTLAVTVKWIEDTSRRITQTVKITNQDDPSQFVNVERITQMVIKNNKTAEEIAIKPNWGA